MMKLDWDDLRIFLTISEQGNLSAASRALKVSQPTVGRRLKALEDNLGTVLFDRLPDGLALTTHGEQLIPLAQNMEQAANAVLELAEQARRRGVLDLQNKLPGLIPGSFAHRAMTLVVDGLPEDEIARMLDVDVRETASRHQRSAGVLRRAGEVAPAMGLIGTLVGLVQMLGNLEDPSAIGPAMAVALLTTFYGAILANMVFNPLAGKLERNSELETLVNHIYAVGAAGITRQENPRRLEMVINTVLAPAARVRHFD